jgi:hypothetical protein
MLLFVLPVTSIAGTAWSYMFSVGVFKILFSRECRSETTEAIHGESAESH